MAFTAKDVQSLRERTGCGMMDCKKALTQTDGDVDKAIEFLREKGLAAVAKKAGRIAAEGVVFAMTKNGVSAVVEVNAETDFVAKNDSFMAFVNNVAEAVIDNNPADVDALLKCETSEGTIDAQLTEKIQTIGENIKVRRFARYEGKTATYIHAGGKIGVMVKFDVCDCADGNEAFIAMGKDVAMQIAAVNPLYLKKEDVPADEVAKEKEILIAQAAADPKNAGKPAQVLEKMVEGRLNKKFFQDSCLLEQAFVKDGNLTVSQYIAGVAKTLDCPISVVEFVRFEKGEGIEKKEDNFAEEVASLSK